MCTHHILLVLRNHKAIREVHDRTMRVQSFGVVTHLDMGSRESSFSPLTMGDYHTLARRTMGDYHTLARRTMEIILPEGHIIPPEGCIIPPEGRRRP